MYPTTFVSAFIQLNYDSNTQPLSVMQRIEHFKKIAESGVAIVVYCSQCYYEILCELKIHDAILLEVVELHDLNVYKVLKNEDIAQLPNHRNEKKDSFEYICLMNSKTELVEKTLQKNPFGSTHYAWIDFNFFHIFHNNSRFSEKEAKIQEKIAFEWLSSLKTRAMIVDREFLALPGCWSFNYENPYTIVHEICWRFSGGYFVGTRQKILEFCKICAAYWLPFLQEYRTLTWEVNYWSWLEWKKHISPNWFHADHDSAMLTPSNDYTSLPLNLHYTTDLKNQYPPMQNFLPTSMSICHWNGHAILNTRFVNYEILGNGSYYIKHPQHHLHTRNVCSFLNAPNKLGAFREMFECVGELEDHCDRIYGLEDLRLYVCKNHNDLRFIATNNSHVKNDHSRIIRGIYDIEKNLCRNLCLIEPPTNTYSEKNWIPLPEYGRREGGSECDYDYFIYSWYPYQIGRIRQDVNLKHSTLEIIVNIENHTPRFDRVRGSTNFVECEQGWLGVVHLSEEHYPRHYYHMMILLDKETFLPKKYSRTFVFHKQSIEFCMAFSVNRENNQDLYCFWISNYDKDPEYVEVLSKYLNLEYSFFLG